MDKLRKIKSANKIRKNAKLKRIKVAKIRENLPQKKNKKKASRTQAIAE